MDNVHPDEHNHLKLAFSDEIAGTFLAKGSCWTGTALTAFTIPSEVCRKFS